MSAPDTNTDEQTRRHRPFLVGIGFALVAAILVVLVALFTPGEQAGEDTSGDAMTGPGSPALAPAEMDAPYTAAPGDPAPSSDNTDGN